MGARTYHVAGAAIGAEEIPAAVESGGQPDEELGAAFETGERVARARLQPRLELGDGEGFEPQLVDLGLVVGVGREDALDRNQPKAGEGSGGRGGAYGLENLQAGNGQAL